MNVSMRGTGTTDDGAAIIHVKGKCGKERSVPIEAELLAVVQTYLDSRAIRCPDDRSDEPGR
jgi:integrase/recombinase XerC